MRLSLAAALSANRIFDVGGGGVAPGVVENLTLDGAGETEVSVIWEIPLSGDAPTSYRVQIALASTGFAVLIVNTTTTDLFYTFSALTEGTAYDVRVRAQNASGVSAYETLLAVYTLPAAPTGVNATAGDTEAEIDWTDVAGRTYNIYRATVDDFGSASQIASALTGPTYTATGLTNGTEYFFWVTAVNSSGEGAESASTSATPAGSGGGWPSSLDGTLRLRLEGDNVSGLSDGDPVTTWLDQSGNGFNATQSTGSAKPEWVQTDTDFNSQSTLLFDGVDDGLNCGVTASQPCTVFLVQKSAETGTDYWLDGSGSNRISLGYGLSGTPSNKASVFAGGSVLTATNTNSGACLWRFTANAGSSSLYVNGVSEASGSAGSNSLSDATIGYRSTLYMTGTLAALVIVEDASGTDITAIEDYLTTKYGL